MQEYPTYLVHYGIKGQKWGDRRYQNEDGSLTEEGRRKYGIKDRLFAKNYGIRDRMFIKSQYKLNKKFDKYTSKIKADQDRGKRISNRRVRKALNMGTQYRMNEYYHNPINRIKSNVKSSIYGRLKGTGAAMALLGAGGYAVGSYLKKQGYDTKSFRRRAAATAIGGTAAATLGTVLNRKHVASTYGVRRKAALKDLEDHGITFRNRRKKKNS